VQICAELLKRNRCCRLVMLGHEFLRIAVDERGTRGLYLHHQAVAFEKA